MTRRAIRFVVLLVLLAAATTPVLAQEATLNALRRAEVLMLEGRFDSAQARLELLMGTEVAAVAMLYLGGIQYQVVGNLDSARALIRATLALDFSLDLQPYAPMIDPQFITEFERLRDETAQQSPARITVTAHPWANVMVDDEELGATPIIEYRLRPGRHTVVLSRDGYRRQTETVTLPPGGRYLLGPTSLLARTDTVVIPQRPLRERIRQDWSMRAVLALDTGDTREALQQLGAEPEVDSLRAVWLALRGMIHQLEGASDLAQRLYGRAIEHSPGLNIGPDDLNPAVAGLFATTRTQMMPVASFLVLSPDSILVNRDLVYLRLATRRAARVIAELRDLRTGVVVWRADSTADSIMALAWNGRSAPDLGGGPIPGGRYELSVHPKGLAGLDGTGFTKSVEIRSAPPDTSLDPGTIPDSLLVRETRGGGARAGLVIQGLVFGALAGGLLVAADQGWAPLNLEPASGAVMVGSVTAAMGLLGAILLDTKRPVKERVERNARARALWEARRQEIRDLNALRLSRPYPLVVRISP